MVSHNHLLSKLSHYSINGQYLIGLKIFCLIGKSKSFLEMHTAYLVVSYLAFPKALSCILSCSQYTLMTYISSKIRLYAEIYRAILSNEDASILQECLYKLVYWAATWLISLNLNNLHANTNKITFTNYSCMYMQDQGLPIHEVTSAKYLGVTISQKFCWHKHIDIITCKANSIRTSY